MNKILVGTMRAAALIGALGLCSVSSAQAHGHGWGHGGYGHHGGASFGLYLGDPFFGDPFYRGGYPYYRPYPPLYYDPAPTVIIEREPPVYVQRQPPVNTTQTWYYCPNPAGYYPHVPSCNQQWVPVDPATLPPGPR